MEPNPLPDWGVIVVTHNRRAVLRRLLDQLSEIDGLLGRTIVIDNGSSDGTSELVRRQFPGTSLIRLPRNYGVPYARNLGALMSAHDVVLFLDDDGGLDVGRIPALVRRMCEDPALAVLGLDVVADCDGARARSVGGADSHTGDHADLTLVPSPTFSGGAALVRRSAFFRAGLFPAHFFYSLEEDDLAFRLLRCGYRVAVCPWVRFFHQHVVDAKRSRKRARFYYRNRLYVCWRNLPVGIAFAESIATLLGGVARTLGTACFWGFAMGYLEALGGLPEVVRFEREPLTHAEYRRYRRAFGPFLNPVRRWWHLMADVRRRQRLDWL